LLDFGLARPAAAMPASGIAVTQAGVGVGTCGFTAPEQLEGVGEPDARADVYGLGAILYFLLTGRPPYQGQTVNAVLAKQMTKPPDPIDFPSLGLAGAESIEAIVLKAMSIRPEDRYQSVAEFKGALEAILTNILSSTEHHGVHTGDTLEAHGRSTLVHGPRLSTAQVPLPPRGNRKRWLLAAGIAGLLVCGAIAAWALGGKKGTGPSSSSESPSLTTTAPGVTANEVVLGLSAPFSGPAKELGRGMQVGIETYLQHVNESQGGIHGRKLRLLALDDGYDPKRCAETMKEMLGPKPVFAFVGNVGTPTAEVALPLILEHKRVLFGAFTGAALLRRDPPDRYVFNYRASYGEETSAIVQYLMSVRKIKPEEIAIFAQQDLYGLAGLSGVGKALRKAGFDVDKVVQVGYQRNSIDIDAAVTEVLKHKDRIKAIIMVPTYVQAAAFIKRIRDGGMNPIFTSVSFVGSQALVEQLKETAPKYGEGVIVTEVVPFPESSATSVLQYRERLAKFYQSEKPSFLSLEGYIDAQILCTGLEAAGPELTTEKLVDALESMGRKDFGLGAPLSFDPSEHQASHKVWATVLDAELQFKNLELE
jgi:ABC-type branched-subunit amino acid transport system substrate-binding protein